MKRQYFSRKRIALFAGLAICVFMAGVWLILTATKWNHSPEPKTVLTGSGNVVREAREVSGLTGTVQLEAPGELIITPGEENELTVEAEDTFLGVIQTRVENGTLVIALTVEPNATLKMNHPIRYFLAVKDIHALKLFGPGSIEALDIQTDNLKVVLNGGGKMHLAGNADTQRVEVNGGGIYQAEDLKTRSITLNGDGGLDATVWVTEHFDGACKGACSIKYYGDPELRTNISLVGTVTRLGDK